MSEQRVVIEIEDHVADVRLSRPEKHNALDGAMFQAIVKAAERLRSEPGVRAVVLHGEGPSFCSGLDIAGFMTEPGETTDLLGRSNGDLANFVQRVSYDWSLVPDDWKERFPIIPDSALRATLGILERTARKGL